VHRTSIGNLSVSIKILKLRQPALSCIFFKCCISTGRLGCSMIHVPYPVISNGKPHDDSACRTLSKERIRTCVSRSCQNKLSYVVRSSIYRLRIVGDKSVTVFVVERGSTIQVPALSPNALMLIGAWKGILAERTLCVIALYIRSRYPL